MSNDPCPTCGAAMAADQRYCLACGNRRAEARLDYLEILRGRPTAAVPAAPAAQVIKVQGGGTAAASTAAPKAKSRSSASKKGKGSSKVATAKTASESKATNPTLKALENTSGDDYAKQSQKLPKVVSTGGKAPPIDKSKPAAGGGDFESIG